jgi:hypothetical protein
MLTCPGDLNSSLIYSQVRVTQSLIFCVVICVLIKLENYHLPVNLLIFHLNKTRT